MLLTFSWEFTEPLYQIDSFLKWLLNRLELMKMADRNQGLERPIWLRSATYFEEMPWEIR
ncbi:MAG TPA: hypothetical protein DDZ80_16070 [Cyanobacteria bacterium UBA8803]|nr:hypothetical protein [Cyanobacteria bacterium UBA9273]HBL59932.1 hypothetical protein [Cyanobacteria bacterium UBA8803]